MFWVLLICVSQKDIYKDAQDNLDGERGNVLRFHDWTDPLLV